MTLRPPKSYLRTTQIAALDYEIAQEQASALGRLGRALESALSALADHDRILSFSSGTPARPAAGRTQAVRAKLVQDASEALWCFMVQREACGLRDPRPILREYRVPAEVYGRVGILVQR
ncbi:MAG: DUF6665 family protein [Xanthobacteraceae bacterium]